MRLKLDYSQALAGLGRALAAQGKLTEAETLPTHSTSAQLIRKSRSNWQILMATGQTNEAAMIFASASQLKPDLADENLRAGKTLAARGQLDAAFVRFTVAAWLMPGNADAHENLGLLLAPQGKF